MPLTPRLPPPPLHPVLLQRSSRRLHFECRREWGDHPRHFAPRTKIWKGKCQRRLDLAGDIDNSRSSDQVVLLPAIKARVNDAQDKQGKGNPLEKRQSVLQFVHETIIVTFTANESQQRGRESQSEATCLAFSSLSFNLDEQSQ